MVVGGALHRGTSVNERAPSRVPADGPGRRRPAPSRRNLTHDNPVPQQAPEPSAEPNVSVGVASPGRMPDGWHRGRRTDGGTGVDEQRYREAEDALWAHWGAEPIDRWVRLGTSGPRLRVQEVGDPDGPPVLFVHGASVAGACWADLASRLPTARCLLLDRPGCGLSEPVVPPPGLEGLPALGDRLVADVLDGLGIEQAHLVSNSMGGYFALRAAAVHPGRVLSVTHMGWALGAPIHDVALIMRLAGNRVVGRLMMRLPVTPAAIRWMFRQTGLGDALAAGRIPEVGIAWNVALQNHTDTRTHEWSLVRGASMQEQIESLVLPPDLLARIEAPVRIVFGTGDPFGTVASMQALADAIPRGELEVWEDTGHAVWLDDLGRAVQTVRGVVRAA